MAKLSVFNYITLDGYYKGPNEDISWHNFGEDEQALSDEASNQGHILLFGRVTYEMMASYWTSEMAMKNDPVTAKGMNESEKIVFSKTLKAATWANTRLVISDAAAEVQRLKKESERDLTIMGSGQLTTFLAKNGLIDEYSLVVNPLAIGEGTPLFKGLSSPLKLNLAETKTFKSGNVLLTYRK